jgi:uncharacterized cupredoxin-like copper-binding protein
MNIMKSCSAAAVSAILLSSITMAGSTPGVVHVSLLGEADQPMSVKTDATSIKAGKVEFIVTNDAIVTDHEVVLVKLSSKHQKIYADTKKHRIDEKKLESMGEVGGLKPGDKGTLKVKLTSGDYVLLCNHKSHYELGMATPFTVTN